MSEGEAVSDESGILAVDVDWLGGGSFPRLELFALANSSKA